MKKSILRSSVLTATGLSLAMAMAGCSMGGSGDSSSSAASSSMSSMSGESSMSSDASMSSSADASMPMPKSTGDPFADAMTAAKHMPMVGETLAAGIASGNGIKGDVDSPAADLRAKLNANLQEHVYLAGMGVATAYTKGADSDEFKAASAAMDKNAVALADMVGSIDPDMKAPVLKVWRQHLGYFVDYAVAAKSKDSAGMKTAQKHLSEYTVTAGKAFASLSKGNLKAADVTDGLKMHVKSLSLAIDDLAAGKTSAYDDLQKAASGMSDGISGIAAGLAKGAGMKGDSMDDASSLRTTLTMDLQEHVYLAGVTVFTAYTTKGGTDSAAFKAAAKTLDDNSVALSEAVGSVGGEKKEKAFLSLWRQHIGYFVDYAEAKGSGDDEAAQAALKHLDSYRGTAGKFFADLSKNKLDADEIATGLGEHVSTLSGTIDSLAGALAN